MESAKLSRLHFRSEFRTYHETTLTEAIFSIEPRPPNAQSGPAPTADAEEGFRRHSSSRADIVSRTSDRRSILSASVRLSPQPPKRFKSEKRRPNWLTASSSFQLLFGCLLTNICCLCSCSLFSISSSVISELAVAACRSAISRQGPGLLHALTKTQAVCNEILGFHLRLEKTRWQYRVVSTFSSQISYTCDCKDEFNFLTSLTCSWPELNLLMKTWRGSTVCLSNPRKTKSGWITTSMMFKCSCTDRIYDKNVQRQLQWSEVMVSGFPHTKYSTFDIYMIKFTAETFSTVSELLINKQNRNHKADDKISISNFSTEQ